MTDTETPIEAGARALHEKTYAGLDIGSWDTRSARGRERFLTDAQAVFGSVGVEGLAAEIGRHWLLEPSHAYGDARRVNRSCNCGRTLAPQHFEWRHSQEMTQHEAEAVKAWLLKGDA